MTLVLRKPFPRKIFFPPSLPLPSVHRFDIVSHDRTAFAQIGNMLRRNFAETRSHFWNFRSPTRKAVRVRRKTKPKQIKMTSSLLIVTSSSSLPSSLHPLIEAYNNRWRHHYIIFSTAIFIFTSYAHESPTSSLIMMTAYLVRLLMQSCCEFEKRLMISSRTILFHRLVNQSEKKN